MSTLTSTVGGRPLRQQAKVLIVDDSETARGALRAILHASRGHDWEVVEASSGREGLDALRTGGPFDIILVDVLMPVMDGFETCRALRQVDATVPVVVITARDDLRTEFEGRRAGADMHLVKPIAPTALRSAVAALTAMKRRPPAARSVDAGQ